MRRKGKKPRVRERTCRGKRRYRDKAEAQAALHLIANYSTRTKIAVRDYECDECLGWHITSMRQAPRAGERA